MQHWLICTDSFKDAASAAAVCDALTLGLRQSGVNLTTKSVPLSDGGDGFIALGKALGWGETVVVETCDALQRKTKAAYLWHSATATAWVGVAEASGIQELRPFERDGRITTSLGTGLLLRNAIDKGARKIFLGLGGSATNDGGCGMAHALGIRFEDTQGNYFLPTGATLHLISNIQIPETSIFSDIQFIALSDVSNPLCGSQGATFAFGPQKGIPLEALPAIDAGMQHLAHLWKTQLHKNVADTPGTGAAGGIGAGCLAFFNAQIQSGTQQILSMTDLDNAIQQADAVIAGEGCVDETSFNGKLLSGIVQRCRQHQKPCYLVCGQSRLSADALKQQGVNSIFTVQDYHTDIETSIAHTLPTLQKIGKKIPLQEKLRRQ